jgi:hypothetical protein
MKSPKLVLVHLGRELPQYLVRNLRHLKQIFPQEKIYLIIDSENHAYNPELRDIELFVYRGVDLKWGESLQKNSHSSIFRDGFWRKTIERIFAVIEFHKTISEKCAILHVESDVFLTPNFPLVKLNNNSLPELGWCPYSSKEDVAALLYSRNLQSSLELGKLLVEVLSEDHNHTDMTALNRIKQIMGRNVFYFPLTPTTENIEESIPSTISGEGVSEINKFFHFFGGVFDSLSAGMYTWGIDPRNTYGFTLIHNNSQSKSQKAYIIPQQQCVFLDSSGRLVHRFPGKEVNLFATHIHSKNVFLFDKLGSHEMNRILSKSKNRHIYSFKIGILLSLLKSNWQEGTLFRYLTHPLRKRLRLVT